MARARLHVRVRFDTAARANNARAQLQARLDGLDLFDAGHLRVLVTPQTRHVYLSGDWRFNRDTDRDDVRTWVRSNVPSLPGFVAGRAFIHLCPHDEEERARCTVTGVDL